MNNKKKINAHTGHDPAARAATNDEGRLTVVEIVSEGHELTQREEIIERNLQTYVEVGTLLAEIRDQRLYLAHDYDSFQDYCRRRWHFSRVYGWRLCQEATLALALEKRGFSDVLQAHVKELLPLIDRKADAPDLNPAIEAYATTAAETDGPPQTKHLARTVRAWKAEQKAAILDEDKEDLSQSVMAKQDPGVNAQEKPSSMKAGDEVDLAAARQDWISELQACRSSADQLRTLLVKGKVRPDRLELLEQVCRSIESVLGAMAGSTGCCPMGNTSNDEPASAPSTEVAAQGASGEAVTA